MDRWLSNKKFPPRALRWLKGLRASRILSTFVLLGLVVALLVLLAVARARLGPGWLWAGWAQNPSFGGKTVWEWLDLLIVPIVLAFGAFLLNLSERRNEQRIAETRRKDDQTRALDQQRETAMQRYITAMTELLMDDQHPLRRSAPGDEVRVVARTLTLSTLRMLDPDRKGLLIHFLHESGLIATRLTSTRKGIWEAPEQKPAIISLNGANLTYANLQYSVLENADFSEADLSNANLSNASLNGSDFHLANLTGTTLRWMSAKESCFQRVLFRGATIEGSNFESSDFLGSIFENATVTESNFDHSRVNVHVENSNFQGSSFVHANLSHSVWSAGSLSDTLLDHANLRGVMALGTKMPRVSLTDANLKEAGFIGCDLTGSKLCSSKLAGTKFRQSTMRNVDLVDAILDEQGIEPVLEAATLQGAILPDGSTYDPAVHIPRPSEPRPSSTSEPTAGNVSS